MKTMMRVFLMAAVVALVTMGCGNKDSEKKIAQLESRLLELEGKKAAPSVENAPAITPATAAPEAKPEGPLPVAQFETIDHDFGTINEGDIVEYTYEFKNTGEAPLIIQGAQGSCGCTVPEWSKDPIPAGGTGFVKAKFDSQGKPNTQNKTVTVTANTWPKQTVLRFKAMVLPKAVAPGSAPIK